MTFKCDDCKNDIEYDKQESSYYKDSEGYVVGFQIKNTREINKLNICDRCYAKDSE